ncbi:MAG: DUF5692 family protein, partial [[Clostridium] scindens]
RYVLLRLNRRLQTESTAPPTFANALWNKGGWIQNRANTLACGVCSRSIPNVPGFCVTRHDTDPVFPDGFMMQPQESAAADPTMQGVVALLALAANVICLAVIIKRSKQQKKNPYKNEIPHGSERFPDCNGEKEASIGILIVDG